MSETGTSGTGTSGKDENDWGGNRNSGEHVSQQDIEAQQGISGWQGGVEAAVQDDGAAVDEDSSTPDDEPLIQ